MLHERTGAKQAANLGDFRNDCSCRSFAAVGFNSNGRGRGPTTWLGELAGGRPKKELPFDSRAEGSLIVIYPRSAPERYQRFVRRALVATEGSKSAPRRDAGVCEFALVLDGVYACAMFRSNKGGHGANASGTLKIPQLPNTSLGCEVPDPVNAIMPEWQIVELTANGHSHSQPMPADRRRHGAGSGFHSW
ncbi:hypothetical protein DL771_006764 [Monosporascus sp. 5C6A]|nr:hypothetical protein DL771_006764 [Monosporascus sp. 5C6A]